MKSVTLLLLLAADGVFGLYGTPERCSRGSNDAVRRCAGAPNDRLYLLRDRAEQMKAKGWRFTQIKARKRDPFALAIQSICLGV